MELAGTHIGPEVWKRVLQILLQDHIHLIGVEGGKSGGIRNIGVFAQVVQLHMAGGMAATAQLLGDLAGSQLQLRAQPIENAALAHTGVAGKGHQLAPDQLPQFLHAFAGFGTGADDRKACMAIDPNQIHRRIQVALVHAQNHRNLLVTGDGSHPVDEEGLRHRIDIGGKNHQRIHIGHRRPDEAVFPGQDLLHHALSLLHGDFHHIAGQRAFAGFPENAPGPAGDQLIGSLHIIKTAD